MPIIRSALYLLMLDLLTKHAFRFYEQDLALELVLIDGYLYVDEVVFNYENAQHLETNHEKVEKTKEGQRSSDSSDHTKSQLGYDRRMTRFGHAGTLS